MPIVDLTKPIEPIEPIEPEPEAPLVEVWVPVVLRVGEDGEPYYTPDLPKGTPFTTRRGLPVDLRPDSPTYGRPLNAFAPVLIDSKLALTIQDCSPDAPKREHASHGQRAT